jgi:hypothetical protein
MPNCDKGLLKLEERLEAIRKPSENEKLLRKVDNIRSIIGVWCGGRCTLGLRSGRCLHIRRRNFPFNCGLQFGVLFLGMFSRLGG